MTYCKTAEGVVERLKAILGFEAPATYVTGVCGSDRNSFDEFTSKLAERLNIRHESIMDFDSGQPGFIGFLSEL
jgi:hypothetical protein